jgi:uncharacterized protein YndB with AHSA1/START domain
MKTPKITHDSFVIEKIYNASSESVFAAWGDIKSKAQWFIGPDDWKPIRREIDFRVGGLEVLHGKFGNGFEPHYEARFYSIIPNERIVFVYDMHLNGNHHSVSIASVEVESLGVKKTRLTFTEQVSFMDGTDGIKGSASRREGTLSHLNRLEAILGGANT